MKLEKYCTCGAVLKVTVPARKRQQALIVFYNQHSGEGHEPCSAGVAEQARMGTGAPMGREARKEK